MQHRPLSLQPRPQHIQGIDYRCTHGSTDGSNSTSGEIADGNVVFVTAVDAGFAGKEEAFAVFEDEEVDGRVREHARQTHAKPTVVGADAGGGGEHLHGGGADEGVALKTTGDDFALHAAARRF